MTNTINLNKARKSRERLSKKKLANANAVKFGRTKSQRRLEATQEETLKKRLDGLKFESE